MTSLNGKFNAECNTVRSTVVFAGDLRLYKPKLHPIQIVRNIEIRHYEILTYYYSPNDSIEKYDTSIDCKFNLD